MRSLVVLPTYDEAPNIAEVIRRLRQACAEIRVLVVDDASPDGTAEVVEALSGQYAGIELLRRSAKSGLGSAYRDGFRRGLEQGFDILVAMDSDLSHDPGVLPRLLEAVEGGVDLAIGSRYVPGGSIPDWSRHRRLLSKWGNRYAGFALGMNVADATSGYRAFRATTIARIDFQKIRADGYGFQIEMAYRMLGVGGTVREIPISFVDRVRGKSKMSPLIVAEALALVTWWGLRDRLRRLSARRS
ncbi:MAG: polyprenol monophosphomannose synthase [Acidimicrobiaceae bacterium]|nr:polyprenol monophosphomannose synthase [Acidimicrobiaceae bacterium]